MIATQRRLRFAVIPVAFAALALTGCQDEAPSAAPPTAAGGVTSQQPTSAPSAPTAVETSSPSPTSQYTPPETTTSTSTSPPVTGGSGGCSSSSSYDGKPGAAPKPIAEAQTFQDSRASVTVTPIKPTIDSSGSDSFFPGAGKVTAVFPITVKASGGSFVVSSLQVSLIDGSQAACQRDTLGRVVPSGDQLPVKILADGDSISAKAAFAVPAGADLSKYQLLFSRDSGTAANLAWNGS